MAYERLRVLLKTFILMLTLSIFRRLSKGLQKMNIFVVVHRLALITTKVVWKKITALVHPFQKVLTQTSSITILTIYQHMNRTVFLNEGSSVEGHGRLGASPLVGDSNHTRIPPNPSPTARKDPSAKSFLIDETPLQEKLPKIDESLPANLSQTYTRPVSTSLLSTISTPKETGYEGYGLDERLRRVEAMLDCLVGSDSSTATMSHVGRLNPPTQIVQHDNDYPSVASSFNPLTTPTPTHRSHEGHVEVEALRKEIEDLKIQLAAKNDSNASTNLSHELRTEAHSVGETSELKSRSKLRGRIKNILFSGKQAK
mmetsp:Transcript_5122/g.8811  ORF Transcript_5122/g.8811 Transcript_5122/m.8811 type:complete len:313 (-) Transcript_5122:146-1084(-)